MQAAQRDRQAARESAAAARKVELEHDMAENKENREEAARIRAHDAHMLGVQLQISQAKEKKAQTELMNRMMAARGSNLPDTRHVSGESSGASP